MRIAFLADSGTGNGYYRALGPMSALARRGHAVRQLRPGDRLGNESVDVLHIHRYTGTMVDRLVAEATADGAAVVWDNDDDMGSIPRGTPAYKRFGGLRWERKLAEMRRLFRHVDLVTAPSAALAERLLEAGAPRVDVIENRVQKTSLCPPHRPSDVTTIGWVAGLEHRIDLESIPLVAVLQRMLDERPDIRVTTIGLGLGLRDDRYRHIPLVEIAQLTRHASEFDIAIAPLSDIAMNRSRSNVKVKEYAAAGIAWLASPIGPYVGMGEKEGGRLVADDHWYEELSLLIDKKRDRWKLAKRAAKWAEDDTVERCVGEWEQKLSAAVAHARATAASALTV